MRLQEQSRFYKWIVIAHTNQRSCRSRYGPLLYTFSDDDNNELVNKKIAASLSDPGSLFGAAICHVIVGQCNIDVDNAIV